MRMIIEWFLTFFILGCFVWILINVWEHPSRKPNDKQIEILNKIKDIIIYD
jgi:hypothetical protein